MHPTMASQSLGCRRKVVFLYHSLQASGPAFQWACDHLLRSGFDHVTLLNVFTDEAFQVVDAKKLWKVATEQIQVEVEYKKKLDRVEQEMEIFRTTLASLDILARTVIMPEGDAKNNIIKVAHSINAELLILSPNIVTPFQRAVHGSLEEHLLRHGDFSVIIAKPKTRCISPKIRRDSGLGSSVNSSPTEIPIIHVPTITPPKPIPAQKSFPQEVSSPSPLSSELQSETDSAHESDVEPDVLATFQDQLGAYHTKATLDASEVWDLSDDVLLSHQAKPEESAEPEPNLEAGLMSPRGFRPRAPQPLVKSIIETLPSP